MHPWIEKHGLVYFSLPAIKLTESSWVSHFFNRNIKISETAYDLLSDLKFKTTTDSVGDVVVIRKSQFLGNEDEIDIEKLFSIKKDGFEEPSPELGCIVLHLFSSEEIKAMIPVDGKGKRKIGSNLDFNIIIMNPIEDKEGDKMVFFISCKKGEVFLEAITNYSLNTLKGEIAFVFKVSSNK